MIPSAACLRIHGNAAQYWQASCVPSRRCEPSGVALGYLVEIRPIDSISSVPASEWI